MANVPGAAASPSTPNPTDRTVQLGPLFTRALVTPTSINADARTVDVTWTTGAPVERRDWWTGDRYIEVLSTDPRHVRLDRLNSGAPLLDTHGSYSVADMLGAVVRGSAKMASKNGQATLQFSRRPDVEPFWRDVQDGVLSNVSVGYRVYAFTEVTPKDGGLPTRTAIDWEPYELSMVPMPADVGAQTRAQSDDRNPCQIVSRAAPPAAASPVQENAMDPETSETIVERNPLDPGAPLTRDPDPKPAEKSDAQIGADVERQRVQGIMAACRASRMTTEFQDKLIAESVTLLDAQTRVFDEMRKRGGEDRGPAISAVHDVKLGPDPLVHVRAGIENALCHRLAGEIRRTKTGEQYFPLSDVGRKYRGMTMLDIARVYLQGRGMRVTDMSKHELAGVALGIESRGGGMHTTSDFSNLLADVASKTLRAAYEEQPQTFQPLVTVVFLSDFKPVNAVQLGDAPALLEILEDGEYKSGTISDGKETYQLKSYGRKFAITRKALINDDTNAFARVPMMFGRKARVLESNLVWAEITGNPTMGDGFALFSAQHGNLETDGDHITVDSLGRGRASLRRQTSLDGDYLNLNAAYILVPTNLETKADQFVTVVTPQAAGSVNPFQSKLQVIAEPRLDANSSIAWYLAASTGSVDIIHLAYLEGQPGPRVESRIGFDIEGLEIKCGLDVAAKAVDWRGLHKDPGDLDS